MNKDVVLTAFGSDEAKALFGIVPFDGTLALRLGIAFGGGYFRTTLACRGLGTLGADVEHLDDLAAPRTLRSTMTFRCVPSARSWPPAALPQYPNVQIDLGAVRQFDKPETFAALNQSTSASTALGVTLGVS